MRQHGVVATWQLKAHGYSPSAIKRRAAMGRLHRVYRGVYAVGYRRIPRKGRWMAAILACGQQAVLSHRAALALWELRPVPSGPIDVTVPGSGRPGQDGIRVHSARTLHAQDHGTIDGVPVTALHRTLLDYAEVARHQQLRLAFEAAERRDLFDLSALQQLLARSPGRRGAKPLDALLVELHGCAPWTQSELERRFLALIREAGLPEPAANVVVAGVLVDFYWPEARLVVEVDGFGFHKTRRAFEEDRRRDARLQVARCVVLRVTQARIEHEVCELVVEVVQLLSPGRRRA